MFRASLIYIRKYLDVLKVKCSIARYAIMYSPLFVGVLSLFCYALLCVHSSFAIILKRKRKLVALLLLPYRCTVTINALWLFRTMPWVGLQYVIVVFPDHTHLLFYTNTQTNKNIRNATTIVNPQLHQFNAHGGFTKEDGTTAHTTQQPTISSSVRYLSS